MNGFINGLKVEGINKNNLAAKKVAYDCLAHMAANRGFDDVRYSEQSNNKTLYKLQAEDEFKKYGYGTEIPVPEIDIRIFREIQREYWESRDNKLKDLIDNHNMDFETLLKKGGSSLVARIFLTFNNLKGKFYLLDFDGPDYSTHNLLSKCIQYRFLEFIREEQKCDKTH